MKYELLENDTIIQFGRTLHRIRSLKDFVTVDGIEIHTGDLGGCIESFDNLSQEGMCWVSDNAQVFDDSRVFGDARVSSNSWVYGNSRVFGNAQVSDDAQVYGDADVFGNAQVSSRNDIIWIAPIGSRSDNTTFFKTATGEIAVACGCFQGNIEQFLEAVEKTHGDNHYAQVYRSAAELARMQILGFKERNGESCEDKTSDRP